jgi:hypothetical protein
MMSLENLRKINKKTICRSWQSVSIFPRHFHDGSEDRVIESSMSEDPAQALREFLGFAREKLRAAPLSPPGGEAGG